MATLAVPETKTMHTLPGDAVRQILWRFADRFDLQMLVQSARGVARGTVARLVAAGERNTHEWTPAKDEMMEAFDRSGITAAFMEPEEGGFIAGPKNLALAPGRLRARVGRWRRGNRKPRRLSCALARSTSAARRSKSRHYKTLAAPPQPGEDRKPWRGAFALTEPIPYVGVDTGMLSGKVSVAEWKDGEEPMLQVDKRGRFITNIAFANFVTAAVNSDDRASRAVASSSSKKATRAPSTAARQPRSSSISSPPPAIPSSICKVPASRIVGGYTVKDGVIVPNFNHSEIIEAVFRRTRVPVGLMTAAKLLSAVEPVIRYQRQRFRGAEAPSPAQSATSKESSSVKTRCIASSISGPQEKLPLHSALPPRVSSTSSIPLEKQKTAILKERGIQGGRAEMKALKQSEQRAIELLSLKPDDPAARSSKPIPSCSTSSRMPKPTSSALPPSSGTPATAPT